MFACLRREASELQGSAAPLTSRLVEKCVPSGRWLSLPDAADEFGAFMRRQLDMTVEAENLRRFRANFAADGNAGGVRFPRPLLEEGLVSGSVLVESYEEGVLFPVTFIVSGVYMFLPCKSF